MAWTERQRRMLQEMVLRVWAPRPADAPVEVPAVAAAPPARVAPGKAHDAPVAAITPAPSARAFAAPAPSRAEGDERARHIATLDWPALREAVVACTACGLCQGRRQIVFGVGNPRARWMIVGEAPGEQEDLQGEPFVGSAGQLLDNMLRAPGDIAAFST